MARYVLKTESANSTGGIDELIVSDAAPLPVTGIGGTTSNVAIHGNTFNTQWIEPNADGSVNVKITAGESTTTDVTDRTARVLGHVTVDSAAGVVVTSLPALPAGTNAIGHVAVDSLPTVTVNPLPASANVIGHVVTDTGSTVAVSSIPALPAGTNVIGHVIADAGSTVAVSTLPALPAGGSLIGYTADVVALKIGQGKARIAGTKQTTSITAPNASLTISNPNTNTRTVYVFKLTLYADTAADIIYFQDAATTGASVSPFNPNLALSSPSSATVQAGLNVLTGGTQLSPTSRIATQAGVHLDALFVLPPGHSLSVQYSGPGATANAYLNGYYYEE